MRTHEQRLLLRSAARVARRKGLITNEHYAELMEQLDAEERMEKKKDKALIDAAKSKMLKRAVEPV